MISSDNYTLVRVYVEVARDKLYRDNIAKRTAIQTDKWNSICSMTALDRILGHKDNLYSRRLELLAKELNVSIDTLKIDTYNAYADADNQVVPYSNTHSGMLIIGSLQFDVGPNTDDNMIKRLLRYEYIGNYSGFGGNIITPPDGMINLFGNGADDYGPFRQYGKGIYTSVIGNQSNIYCECPNSKFVTELLIKVATEISKQHTVWLCSKYDVTTILSKRLYYGIYLYANDNVQLDILSNNIETTLLTKPGFPYRTTYISPLVQQFNRLKQLSTNYPINWCARTKDYACGVVVRSYPKDYNESDSISDHYAEHVRIKCKEQGKMSPYEAWIELLLTTPSVWKLDAVTFRENVIYEKARGCNLFNAGLATYLISRYGGPRAKVMDKYGGYGDRLWGAGAADAELYLSFDTNPNLQPVYNKIIETLPDLITNNMGCAVVYGRFEDNFDLFAPGGPYNQMFDIVMESPPFEWKEIYEGELTSTTTYKSRKDWYNNFYIPSIYAGYNAVRSGGFIIAYLPSLNSQYKDMPLRQMEILSKLRCEYIGQLGFIQLTGNVSSIARSVFIWNKY